MTKKLVWRLATKPTVDEITTLLDKKIITETEAKELLFNEEEPPKKATKSELDDIRSEMKFIRDFVMNLRGVQVQPIIIERIKEVERDPWVRPWITWSMNHLYDNSNKVFCSSSDLGNCSISANALDIR